VNCSQPIVVSPTPAIAVIDGKEVMNDDLTKRDTERIPNEVQLLSEEDALNMIDKRCLRRNTEENLNSF
jgi:hypothetical protein